MSTAVAVDSPLRVALLGAPNSGKTTLFNALTGSRARVGNYPGVTVERREGAIRGSGRRVRVLDLPGSYSLRGETLDEKVVDRVLGGEIEDKPDALLIVVDATTLQRSLALVVEAIETHGELACAVVVTMVDEMRARSGKIDFNKLSKTLGIPVFPVVGHRGVGMEALTRALERPGVVAAREAASADVLARGALRVGRPRVPGHRRGSHRAGLAQRSDRPLAPPSVLRRPGLRERDGVRLPEHLHLGGPRHGRDRDAVRRDRADLEGRAARGAARRPLGRRHRGRGRLGARVPSPRSSSCSR